ncbi:MAG: MSMEG_0565 family glycosyltransferase [Miltoncostaeaceae bacterium]
MRVRIATYSAMPRGGAVHARRLAEELAARGHWVELWALTIGGSGLAVGPGVALHQVPLMPEPGEGVAQRVARGASALAAALRHAAPVDIHHAQDMVSARALLDLRAEGVIPHVVRTVHHVEVFQDDVLEECQRASIQDVDRCLAVSAFWAARLGSEFGVRAGVVPNGVDFARFAHCPLDRRRSGERFGWGMRPVILALGGVQPRKGGRVLLEAFARARGRLPDDALLVVAGGDGLYADLAHLAAWNDDAARLGLRVREGPHPPPDAHVARIGVVADDDMPALYRAADALAFPSTREGFGLVVVEAMAGGLPVVASDIPVLREFLRDGDDCLMTPVGDSGPMAEALVAVMREPDLRARLTANAQATARAFRWEITAERAEAEYEGMRAS